MADFIRVSDENCSADADDHIKIIIKKPIGAIFQIVVAQAKV